LPRYITAIFQTFSTILKKRPKLIFVQNPSAVLSFFTALMKPFFKYTLVIDHHTPCLSKKGVKKLILDKLNKYSMTKGDLIIVTNESYKNKIKKITSKEIFILPDKIPDLNYKSRKLKLKGKNNLLYICSFLEDEPWKEVIKAGKLLGYDFHIYITGKHKNRVNRKKLPKNVTLTGYAPLDVYQNLIGSADSVVVLTTKECCLLCGAYEAVAAEKPLILSDKKALRKYFNRGVIFTKNNAESIAKSINISIKNASLQQKGIQDLKTAKRKEWKKQWNCLLKRLKN
jgi:glycosyltransferase involved in cell wall biosynthesis